MHRIGAYLYKLFILFIFVGVGWRVYSLGYANILSGSFSKAKGVEVYEKSYSVDQGNLGALFRLAKDRHDKGKYKLSNNYLFEALSVDPSYGRAAGLLLSNFSKLGLDEQAQEAAYFASKLWPAHSYVSAHLLDYWLLKDNKSKVFEELNVLLIRNPNIRKSIYPTLDLWAKDNQLKLLFLPYLASPPSWWDSYFRHLSYKKNNLSELEYFYNERLKSDVTLSKSEIRSMTQGFIKGKKWQQARLVWVNGLSPALKKYSKNLFDGGFESGLNNEPFSWHRTLKSKIFKVDIGSTYGMKGRKALHVKFKRKKHIDFRHVSQRVMLPSGKYTLVMRARVDGTVGKKGLKWRLRCLEQGRAIVGETEPFISRKSWHDNVTLIEIPKEGCKVQELRLEASSKFAHHQIFSGSLWFDDMKIERSSDDN